MRFMIIVKANADSEAGVMPSSELVAEMGRFNEELIEAGVLLAGEGLQSSAKGKRVKLDGGKLVVKDGPFAETKELVAGFWLIDVKDEDEALAWTKRIPYEEGDEYELRRVFEATDFQSDMLTEDVLAREQAWRDENMKPITKE
jgi:hypothetical protein